MYLFIQKQGKDMATKWCTGTCTVKHGITWMQKI